MRASEDTYKKVAKNCSSYSAKDSCTCTNKSGDVEVSCTTCKHFAEDKHCKLDLFDPIAANHNF